MLMSSCREGCLLQSATKSCQSEAQGLRPTMEDTTVVHHDPQGQWHLYGVFDGHGGRYVSTFLQQRMHLLLDLLRTDAQVQDKDRVMNLLVDFFERLDRSLYGNVGSFRCGSTATVLLLDTKLRRAFVANVGDSRTVIFSRKGILLETCDHKPNSVAELKRLEKLRRTEPDVIKQVGSIFRVRGSLAVSRAFGDWYYKIPQSSIVRVRELVSSAESRKETSVQSLPPYSSNPMQVAVTYFPDVHHISLGQPANGGDVDQNPVFAILACDGLWDVADSSEVCNYVLQRYLLSRCPTEVGSSDEAHGHAQPSNTSDTSNETPSLCHSIVQYALQKGTRDNVTVMIVRMR